MAVAHPIQYGRLAERQRGTVGAVRCGGDHLRQLQHPAGRAGELSFQWAGSKGFPVVLQQGLGMRRVSEPVHHAAAESLDSGRSDYLHRDLGAGRTDRPDADCGGSTVRGAGLRLRFDGPAAADPGVSDDRGLPRHQSQPARYPGHPAAQAAGDRPAGRVLQPHEALYGAAGEHLTGEKRNRAGIASSKDRGTGIAEPHGAQSVAAAAQPDRPAFFVQHPERHPADGGHRVRLPHAGAHHGAFPSAALQPDEQR